MTPFQSPRVSSQAAGGALLPDRASRLAREVFLREAHHSLRATCKAVKMLEQGFLHASQAGDAWLPVAWLLEQAEVEGHDELAGQCRLLLQQLLNLFQTRIEARPALIKAILEQALVVEREAERAVGGAAVGH